MTEFITHADRDALGRMPEGWFEPMSLHYMIRRREWRCERLVRLGRLESRVVGKFPDLKREYCKKPHYGVSSAS